MSVANTSIATLLELNRSNADIKVFCIHPMGGGMDTYKRLAKPLSTRAQFYGLEDPAVFSGFSYESFEQLASYHVKLITTIQPQGPYFLMGSCSGGPIAYEIANQLSKAGLSVAKVIIIGRLVMGFGDASTSQYGFLKDYLAHRFSQSDLTVPLDDIDWPALEQLPIKSAIDVIIENILEKDIDIIRQNEAWARSYINSLIMWRNGAQLWRAPTAYFDVDIYHKYADINELNSHKATGQIKEWCDWDKNVIGDVSIIKPQVQQQEKVEEITYGSNLLYTVKQLELNSLVHNSDTSSRVQFDI